MFNKTDAAKNSISQTIGKFRSMINTLEKAVNTLTEAILEKEALIEKLGNEQSEYRTEIKRAQAFKTKLEGMINE